MPNLNKKVNLSFLILSLVLVPISVLAQTIQQKVANKAIEEWQNFTTPPVTVKDQNELNTLEKKHLEYSKCEIVDKYWHQGVGSIPKVKGQNNTSTCNWPKVAYYCLDNNQRVADKKPCDKKDKKEDIWDAAPWSAAFISYIMRVSAAGNFKYSSMHSDYIIDAVKAVKEGKSRTDKPFRGYPIASVKVDIGDLICAPRGDDEFLEYTNFEDIIKNKKIKDKIRTSFLSHCDIVVAKNNRNLEVIGGNVGDSVTKTIVPLDSNGHIVRLDSEGHIVEKDEKNVKYFRKWFVVIKNHDIRYP